LIQLIRSPTLHDSSTGASTKTAPRCRHRAWTMSLSVEHDLMVDPGSKGGLAADKDSAVSSRKSPHSIITQALPQLGPLQRSRLFKAILRGMSAVHSVGGYNDASLERPTRAHPHCFMCFGPLVQSDVLLSLSSRLQFAMTISQSYHGAGSGDRSSDRSV